MSMLPKCVCALLLVAFSFAGNSYASDQHSAILPLTFEPNHGQAASQGLFLARTHGNTILMARDGVILRNGPSSAGVRIRLHGDLHSTPVAEAATGGFANYYRSQDRGQWLTHLPLYSRVRYSSIAQGIDVVFHGRDGLLEYDFEVEPRADLHGVKFSIDGADRLSVSPEGALDFSSGDSSWRLLPPVAYQMHAGRRLPVKSAYRFSADGSIGFSVGPYDHSIALTIDPVVQYANLIGVNNNISINSIQVDAAGDLFMAGHTIASDYSVVNGKGPLLNSSDQVFLTKLNPAGDTILYSTFIPASGFSSANSLVVDASGNAYLAGIAGSSDFPLTSTNLGACTQFCNAGFVAKFASDGTMVYSTLLSSGQALPKGLVVDSSGSAYVAGVTADNTLQTVNAFEPSFVGQICTNCTNAFFAKLNATGTGYVFASYFANPNHTSGETFATGIAIDGTGNVFIAGQGDPPIMNPWQVGGALFIAKFAPDGKTLLFSSGFGGNSGNITGIAAGADGTLFLAGRAASDFPFTLNASSHMVQDNGNGMFAAAVDPTLIKLTYATYLGDGNLNAIFLNPANNHLYAAGAGVQNLPPFAHAVVVDAGPAPGNAPGFALELDSLGNPVTVTQFGGQLTQQDPTAIAADVAGNIYVAGSISPGNEIPHPDPILVGPSLGSVTGSSFGSFFAKIAPANAPQISLNTQAPFLFLRNAGSVDLHISSIVLGGNLVTRGGNCGNVVPAGTSCVLTVTNVKNAIDAGTVTITSDAQPAVQAFSISLPPGIPAGTPVGDFVYFSNTSTFFPPELTGNTTAPRAFTLSNIGVLNATITGIFANGGTSQTNNCPATLAPGASCTVQATVTAGAGQPSLRFTYDSGGFKDYELFVPVSNFQFLVSTNGISFNVQEVKGTAIPRTITVTNTGNSGFSVPAPTLIGDPEFTLAGNTCVAPLTAHQSCAIAVQFNPIIAGFRSAILNIAGNQVQLAGTGEFNSVIQLSPVQLNFFPVIVHRPPTTLGLKLTNTSASPVGIAGFSFSLPDYTETDDCLGQVPANGSCNVQVGFSAQAVGPRDATMTINFLGGPVAQTLTLAGGAGVTPLDVTPAGLNFGSALTGTASTSQGVLLGNGRQGAAQDYTLTMSGDFVISQNPCANPMPGFFGCFIQLSFTPKSTGPLHGSLTVSYPGITEQSVVSLDGIGVATGAVVSLPATFDVGSTPVAAGILQPVTISNIGNADLTISGFSLSGLNASDFSVAAGQCATVAAGANCSIQVGFKPGAPLSKQATLTISDNGLNNPHSLPLTGTGIGPSITLPGPTFIGQALLGSFTSTQLLIINSGNADLLISSLTVSGANASEFKTDIALCATIHAPSTCLISVAFTPAAPGTRTATIVVNDNQVGSPQSFTVSGTGLGSAYSAPASLDFGNQIRGSSSPSRTITITNSGNLSLEFSSVAVTGDFNRTNNCFSVAPGASCSITISFSPIATGPRTGILTLADNTVSGTRQISLTGNGTDFQLSGSGNGPVSTTVTAGQPATYNLNLGGSGGFAGSVTLACSGAPQFASCTVNPSTLQLSANGSSAFTVNVATQRVVGALTGQNIYLAGFGLISFVALIPVLCSSRLKAMLRGRTLAMVSVLLVTACFAAIGCGGGGGGAPTKQPVIQTTPAGTYNLTVTATSAGVSRQIALTLVVQ
jgi:hypothetical protein